MSGFENTIDSVVKLVSDVSIIKGGEIDLRVPGDHVSTPKALEVLAAHAVQAARSATVNLFGGDKVTIYGGDPALQGCEPSEVVNAVHDAYKATKEERAAACGKLMQQPPVDPQRMKELASPLVVEWPPRSGS